MQATKVYINLAQNQNGYISTSITHYFSGQWIKQYTRDNISQASVDRIMGLGEPLFDISASDGIKITLILHRCPNCRFMLTPKDAYAVRVCPNCNATLPKV